MTQSLGEILITLGVTLFLFCAYQLFFTNVVADDAMRGEVSDLRRQWAVHTPATRRSSAA